VSVNNPFRDNERKVDKSDVIKSEGGGSDDYNYYDRKTMTITMALTIYGHMISTRHHTEPRYYSNLHFRRDIRQHI